MRVFGIAGFKNSGKTTLIVDLVREFCRRGVRVATVKHAHHDFDVDYPGKDSFLHREAGAVEVIVASARRWAHITELRDRPEPALPELLRQLGPADLVLVEGYKHGSHPRLELRRDVVPEQLLLAGSDPGILLIVSDAPVANAPVPVLGRDNVSAIADFVYFNAAIVYD